jgi:hypothetical protein
MGERESLPRVPPSDEKGGRAGHEEEVRQPVHRGVAGLVLRRQRGEAHLRGPHGDGDRNVEARRARPAEAATREP